MRNLTTVLSCLILIAFEPASAATYKFSPSDLIKIESLSFDCNKAGEGCPKLPLEEMGDVVYLETGDEYRLSYDGDALTVDEPGLLVTYQNNLEDSEETIKTEVPLSREEKSTVRFFPMSKVELSPDSDFYMCAKGQEFTIASDVDFTTIGLNSSLSQTDIFENYQPTSFVCKCFWAPKSLFDELGIEKMGKDSKSPTLPLGFPFPEDEFIKEIKEIVAKQEAQPSQPDTSTGLVTRPTPSYTFSLPPFTPIFSGPRPRGPIRNPVDMVPPSPVGSPCGLFQFGCILQFFTKD